MRQYLLSDAAGREFMRGVVDRCEGHLGRLCAAMQEPRGDDIDERRARIERLEQAVWNSLYQDLSAYFTRRGERFDGLLMKSLDPWRIPVQDCGPDVLLWSPLRGAAYSANLTELHGPRGVIVHTISRFRSRVLAAKQVSEEDWPWRNTLDLAPDNPPSTWFEPGAVCFLRITQGDKSTSRVRSFDSTTKTYNVPLP